MDKYEIALCLTAAGLLSAEALFILPLFFFSTALFVLRKDLVKVKNLF